MQPKRKDTGAPGQPATMKLTLQSNGDSKQPTWQPILPQQQEADGPEETVFSTSPEGTLDPPVPIAQPTADQSATRKPIIGQPNQKKTTMQISALGHASKPSEAFTLGADNRASGNGNATEEKPKIETVKLEKRAKRSRCCF